MPIKVLIVDDSFVMRKLLSDMLSCDDVEVVGTAKSGSEAIKKISQLRPNVITLDLMMPGWDGLTTLKHIMQEHPTPVVILSAHSKEDADITMQCLEAGAVSFILKPSGELSLDIEKVKPKLLEEIKLAAAVDIGKLRTLLVPESPSAKHKLARIDRIVVIGASTGGPQTLTAILTSLPSNFYPPIIVIQHMPSREFTESLAGHLKHTCKLSVKVAEDNELITYKKIYLVPGGYSMRLKTTVKGRETEVVMRLTKDKPDDLTPSINATMRSAAELFDGNAIGVVLTGMGSDGVEGMQAIKDAGGATLAQDESSLIFGMPKAVIDRGCADSVLPAGRIASKIVELVSV